MQVAFVSILVDEARRADPAKGTGTRNKEGKKKKEKKKQKRERTRLSNCEYAKRKTQGRRLE